MPWLLQRYIFRELGRTFLLTALALTAVVGMGGGVLNMIKIGELETAQLLHLMLLVLPVAGALTLPVAALFSAAVTYGRLAGNNEFVACRASGINLHRLFLPTLVLGVCSAAVTFAFINIVIPGMMRNLGTMVREDAIRYIDRQLQKPRGFTWREYRLNADKSVPYPEGDGLVLEGVAFIQTEKGEYIRFGTARQIHLRLIEVDGRIELSAATFGVSGVDRRTGEFDTGHMELPRIPLPTRVQSDLKFLTLGELLYYRRNPQEWSQVQSEMEKLRQAAVRTEVHNRLWERFDSAGRLELAHDEAEYLIDARGGHQIPGDGGLELIEVRVRERRGERVREYEAGRGVIELARGPEGEADLRLSLYEARRVDKDAVREGGGTIREGSRPELPSRPTETRTLSGLPIPPEIQAAADVIDPAAVLGRRDFGSTEQGLARAVRAAEEKIVHTGRDAVAILHQRMAFSLSVFVLIVLAAALGIIKRGAHVLTAFGISFVPAVVVIVAIIMGKQLAEKANTQMIGLGILWSGIALTLVLDGWILLRVLRR